MACFAEGFGHITTRFMSMASWASVVHLESYSWGCLCLLVIPGVPLIPKASISSLDTSFASLRFFFFGVDHF